MRAILESANGGMRRPVLLSHFRSNVRGLYIIGDLAGAPVVKLAMEQGYDVAHHIAAQPDARASEPGAFDVLVIGAGAGGLNAALEAQSLGLRVVVLEKNKVASTIEDFPEGKWIYAEPEARPTKGKLWLEGASKEDLLARWHEDIRAHGLEVRTGEGVESLKRLANGHLEVKTGGNRFVAKRVILATGQRGNPRKLNVPGEDRAQVYHFLYSPKHYSGENILVVGGGNSAVEAALALAEQNRVTISYRGSKFSRLFKDNARKLQAAVDAGRVHVIFESRPIGFGESTCTLETAEGRREIPYDHAFVLIGADAPAAFLKSLGIHMENEWTGSPWLTAVLVLTTFLGIWVVGGKTGVPWLAGLAPWGAVLAAVGFGGLLTTAGRGSRFAWLGVSFCVAYSIYAIKQSENFEYWPYRGWGARAFTFWNRPWSFWYTVLYTTLMTVFGVQAVKRWGFDKKDRFQIYRYASLIGFQWVFFFLIPEFLFRWAVAYQWVGARLAADPNFAQNAWRSYGIIYAWPLFFYTFFGAPHQVWIAWGALLSFGIIPVLVLFHGKRYCSWICGCGGLAETVGDRWRHLAPKGKTSIVWERMNSVVLAAAAVITVLVLTRDAVAIFRKPADLGLEYYHLFADTWLVGIVPVTLYPFLGGKIWCRYWCPLAKMMQMFSAVFTRFRISRFAIDANDKCIACGECTRNCQVGIDVMNFAMKQERIDNVNSSCIGCGICVTVCPMDVLSFQPRSQGKDALIQIKVVA